MAFAATLLKNRGETAALIKGEKRSTAFEAIGKGCVAYMGKKRDGVGRKQKKAEEGGKGGEGRTRGIHRGE